LVPGPSSSTHVSHRIYSIDNGSVVFGILPTIREEIKNSSKKYKDRLQTHPNDLATNLFDVEGELRRLKKFKPSDLSTRFD
jgi:hypothetical protein